MYVGPNPSTTPKSERQSAVQCAVASTGGGQGEPRGWHSAAPSLKMWMVLVLPIMPLEQSAAGQPVFGPHREQNDPIDGSSGPSLHGGRPAGPAPSKLQPHCLAQTGPMSVPFVPNHEVP